MGVGPHAPKNMNLEPGLFLFQGFLRRTSSGASGRRAARWPMGPVPMYTPTVRGGRTMSVGMLCLGRHWNGLTYGYEATRSPTSTAAGAADPAGVRAICAEAAAARRASTFVPTSASSTTTRQTSRLGVHQDKDERPASIEAGIPIVSVSLGDAARFVIGGLARKDPTRPMILRSGDVLVMGGPSRLRFHGVTRILQGTAPEGTGPGRFNLTFRRC